MIFIYILLGLGHVPAHAGTNQISSIVTRMLNDAGRSFEDLTLIFDESLSPETRTMVEEALTRAAFDRGEAAGTAADRSALRTVTFTAGAELRTDVILQVLPPTSGFGGGISRIDDYVFMIPAEASRFEVLKYLVNHLPPRVVAPPPATEATKAVAERCQSWLSRFRRRR